VDADGDLATFGLGDMVRLAASLRDLAGGSTTVVDFASQVCTHLHEHLVDPDGTRQTALVRFYGTLPFAALPADEQQFATSTWGPTGPDVTCLTLLGTVGYEPAWNDRRLSRGHRVIPLADRSQVAGLPMVAALLHELGIDVDVLVSASTHLLGQSGGQPYGVFHVPQASGSAVIPAQDFVTEYGIRSVLGFGGALPTGEVYAVILFAQVEVPRETAELFQTVALSTSLAALEMLATPIFDVAGTGRAPARKLTELERSAARESLLRALLEVHERVAALESETAKRALERATEAAARYGTLARTLQSSLIPPELPSFPGIQTAGFYRPAGDGSEVGGDFYDLFAVRDSVVALALGDVSGKGAGAATLTALARYTIRAAAFHATDGTEVLAALDEALQRHDSEERYLTAMFAFLTPTPDALVVDLTLGGHPAPLVVRKNGDVESIGDVGSALGLLPEPTFQQTRHVLQAGDTLVAFTDGVTEARRGSDQYGDERLRSLLSDCAGLPADAIAAGIGDAVLRFQGEHAHDDTAIVVVRCA
jgi:serine phosphatase RsbU (regulator of sigma subunit)